jgi:hypothetical protein
MSSLKIAGIRSLPGCSVDFNWDFGVFRDFGLTEDVNLQFRMEAFNFTNTPHHNTPENDVDDRDFLVIDDGDDERQFRFTLRLEF